MLILKVIRYGNIDSIRELIHFMRSYYVLCALGFCNQVLFDLQRTLKQRTLQPTTINQVAGVSYVLGSVYAKKSTTRSSPIGYWSKGLTAGWYFRIDQGSGKIPHTCNRLIID